MLHADPHPGNFRILAREDHELGGMGVVDFGAVARLPDHGLPRAIGTQMRIAMLDDYDLVLDSLREEGFVRANIRVDVDELRDYLSPFVEPAKYDRFRFSREWMREQATRVAAPSADGMGMSLRINLPREYVLLHRVWVGGVGVLSQLGTTAPFRAILEESMPGFSR
jgi:predicted unusual protein kinase regulating ubiquinone biosynthesis (AarF/ABC1/UbiB family)